ncbi:MAG: non-heme ferritin [Xanthomonadales bacterium]|nr:non-heme ferritin [Xanthomonadales bacterium]
MLSEKMLEALNEQINLEFYSSNLYLQMSSWCEFNALDGCAKFLKAHAAEEMEHMQRLFTYVNETGGLARVGKIDAPPFEFKSISEVFQATYEHEVFITSKINKLAKTAQQEDDFSTFNFLQWYVAEQHEEEKLFKSIIDKIEMIGPNGLFFIDKEIENMVGAPVG